MMIEVLRPVDSAPLDWPDVLAEVLGSGSAANLQRWAGDNRLHPASLARGFRQLYGVSPSRYRIEQRARRACYEIANTSQPLSAIAQDMGFADQAHMCRDIKAVTGRVPNAWRMLKTFNT